MVTGLQTEQGVVRVPLGTWNVESTHSSVEFSIKHMMIATVRGRFKDFEGTIEAAEDIQRLEGRGRRQNGEHRHERADPERAPARARLTSVVREHFLSGLRSGVNGTPAFFVNGLRHDGGYDLESLLSAVALAGTPA